MNLPLIITLVIRYGRKLGGFSSDQSDPRPNPVTVGRPKAARKQPKQKNMRKAGRANSQVGAGGDQTPLDQFLLSLSTSGQFQQVSQSLLVSLASSASPPAASDSLSKDYAQHHAGNLFPPLTLQTSCPTHLMCSPLFSLPMTISSLTRRTKASF